MLLLKKDKDEKSDVEEGTLAKKNNILQYLQIVENRDRKMPCCIAEDGHRIVSKKKTAI